MNIVFLSLGNFAEALLLYVKIVMHAALSVAKYFPILPGTCYNGFDFMMEQTQKDVFFGFSRA